MLRRSLTLSLVLTVTAFVALTYGGRHCCGGPERPPPGTMLLECGKQIGLEPAQIDRIKSIHLSSQKEIIKLRAELDIAGLELRELLSSESPNKSLVNKKIDELSQLRAKIRKLEVGARIDVMSVLSAEQRERFNEHCKKRMKEQRTGPCRCHHCMGCSGSCMRMGRMEEPPGRVPCAPSPPCAPKQIKKTE